MLKHEFLLECIVILINILKIVKYFELKKKTKQKKKPQKTIRSCSTNCHDFFL